MKVAIKKGLIMNIMFEVYKKFINTWWLLKIVYGLVYIVAGADKFFNLVTYWPKYVSPFIVHSYDTSVIFLLMVVGIIEIVLGLLTLTNWTRPGAYGIALWLFVIIINLLTFGWIYLDIIVRDVVIAVGAVALGRLTTVKEEMIRSQ